MTDLVTELRTKCETCEPCDSCVVLMEQAAQEIERQHEALLKCHRHRWACTRDDCVLGGGPEHDLTFGEGDR